MPKDFREGIEFLVFILMQRSWKVAADSPSTRCSKCSVEAHGTIIACLEREDQLGSRFPENGKIDPLTSFLRRDEVSSSHPGVGGKRKTMLTSSKYGFPTRGGGWQSYSSRKPTSPARGSSCASLPFQALETQPTFLFSFRQLVPKTCYNFFRKQFDNKENFKFIL